MIRSAKSFLATCLVLGPVMLIPLHHALAQSDDDAQAEQDAMDRQKRQEARKDAQRAAPPSALPGAESTEDEAGHAGGDMNPTAALFDAINRGSLGAAKESLNRGADMGAHNVLGQTPLDMAIDLNRNDITFLLLSMRTYNPDGKLETAQLSDTGVQEENGHGHLTLKGRSKRGAPAAVASAPRWDETGGAPRPEAGFLGFGGR